jgi:hypothetical protein
MKIETINFLNSKITFSKEVTIDLQTILPLEATRIKQSRTRHDETISNACRDAARSIQESIDRDVLDIMMTEQRRFFQSVNLPRVRAVNNN